MTRTPCLLACIATLALAACSRQAPQPAGTPAASGAAAATAPAAPATVPATAPAPEAPETPDFDKGMFSGTFIAGDTWLELHADGTYGLVGPDGPSVGSWTHEAGGDLIRLDPGSKEAQDRVFRIVGNDALAQAAPDGRPLPGQRELRRQPLR